MDINEKDNKKYIYTALGFSSTFCITEFVVDIVILMILMFLSSNLYTNYTRSVEYYSFLFWNDCGLYIQSLSAVLEMPKKDHNAL